MSGIRSQFDARTSKWGISDIFNYHRGADDDFSAHMDLCSNLCVSKDVVEFGFRWGQSTAAFLITANSVVSYDINPCMQPREIFEEAAAVDGLKWEFREGDSLKAGPADCDILFIDTDHTADQIYAELNIHHVGVREGGLIIMHDTQTFGQMKGSINKFMDENQQWGVLDHFTNCHGLTVLHRGPSTQNL